MLRSDCNRAGGLLQASASITVLLIIYTSKCSLVMPALISFKNSEFPSGLGWLSTGQGSVSHSGSRHESNSFCPAVFYCNVKHLPQFRLRENILLLGGCGGCGGVEIRSDCLSGTTEDSSALYYLLLQLFNKFDQCMLNCSLDNFLHLPCPLCHLWS